MYDWQVPLQPCTWSKVSSTNNRPNLECPGEDVYLGKSTRCTTGRFPYSRALSRGIRRLITDLSWTDPGEDADRDHSREPILRTKPILPKHPPKGEKTNHKTLSLAVPNRNRFTRTQRNRNVPNRNVLSLAVPNRKPYPR